MAQMNAYPPHRLHSSESIAPSEALELISNYLEAAATDASLHPNALLTETGPVSAAQGVNIGLVLHNLKRLEAGLRGEHLSADLPGEEVGVHDGASQAEAQRLIPNGATEDQEHQNETVKTLSDWQDKAEFEREQVIEQGEIGDRMPAVVDIANKPQVQTTASKGDKELRKQRKKSKRAKEKQEKKISAERAETAPN